MSMKDLFDWADAPMQPTRIYMHPDDYRDLVVWGLMDEGWTEADALDEADRRIEVMQELAEEQGVEALREIGRSLHDESR